MPQLLEQERAGFYIRALLPAAAAQYEVPIAVQPSHAVLLEVPYHGRLFRLNHPVYLSRFAEDGYIYFAAPELSLLSYGRSEEEATKSVFEDFAVLWETIGESPDRDLTPEARQVKAELRAAVYSVTEI